jgi:S-adenosylmethionine-diacylglycerol 3-amino-3-carboxypropyl transferase
MLTGCFPPRTPYDWLALDSDAQTLAEVKPALHCSRMVDVLKSLPTASVDLVHLSNILDWLSPSEASETLRCAERVLKAEGRVIVRQLNSTLQIPELDSGLKWDSSFARRLADRDRSFFYPDIFVGERR